jgi:hypothetical protein
MILIYLQMPRWEINPKTLKIQKADIWLPEKMTDSNCMAVDIPFPVNNSDQSTYILGRNFV